MTKSEPFVGENGPAYARLINVSGRQRMLCQKFGMQLLFALNLNDLDDRKSAKAIENAKRTYSEFEDAFKLIFNGDASNDIPKLHSNRVNHLLKGDQKGEEKITRFFREGKSWLAKATGENWQFDQGFCNFINFLQADLLDFLQKFVECFEADFNDFNERLKNTYANSNRELVDALSEISAASKKSKFLALNAKISVAIMGEQANEFGAIADEIKQLSFDIDQSSALILERVTQNST